MDGLPRTPAVFERKQKWRKLDETDFDTNPENYKSVSGHEDALEKQLLEEEAAEGAVADSRVVLWLLLRLLARDLAIR